MREIGLEAEESVGVDHGRKVDPLEELAHERATPLPATEARPHRDGTRALGGRDHRLHRVLVAPADLHRLERERLDDGQRLRGNGEGHVAGVRAKRGETGKAHRAGHPRLPADNEHRARRVLRVPRPAQGNELEQLRRGAAVLRRMRPQPDVGHDHRARVEAAGADGEPDLPPVERDGEVGIDDRARDLPRGRVDAGGDVHGDDRRSGRVDAIDERGRVRAWLAVEARAEERVDDHVVPLGLRRLVGLAPRLAQHARGDTAVAAVRASAAHAGESACVGERAHRLLRHRGPRTLHELGDAVRVARVALLRAPHLGSRVEGLGVVRKIGICRSRSRWREDP